MYLSISIYIKKYDWGDCLGRSLLMGLRFFFFRRIASFKEKTYALGSLAQPTIKVLSLPHAHKKTAQAKALPFFRKRWDYLGLFLHILQRFISLRCHSRCKMLLRVSLLCNSLYGKSARTKGKALPCGFSSHKCKKPLAGLKK